LTLVLSIAAASFVLLFTDSSRMVKDVKFCRTSEPEAICGVRVIIISEEEREGRRKEKTPSAKELA
jgi:hypothetical protein